MLIELSFTKCAKVFLAYFSEQVYLWKHGSFCVTSTVKETNTSSHLCAFIILSYSAAVQIPLTIPTTHIIRCKQSPNREHSKPHIPPPIKSHCHGANVHHISNHINLRRGSCPHNPTTHRNADIFENTSSRNSQAT